jgi:hypothetical protein
LVDDTSVQRRIFSVASNPTLSPTENDFVPLLSGNDAEELRLRLSLLEALGSYGNALKNLANADVSEEIDKASTELYGALTSLNTTYQKASGKTSPIGAQELGLIATAVDAIGKKIAEERDARCDLDDHREGKSRVQVSGKLIEQELGEDSELAQFVFQSLPSAGSTTGV